MSHIIGTDEAGYGPNLGPLTIAATCWESNTTELYQRLGKIVSNDPKEGDKIVVCDSKEILKSGRSIERLETSVLAILAAVTSQIPTNFSHLNQLLSPQAYELLDQTKFIRVSNEISLPFLADANRINQLADRFLYACEEQDVRLSKIQCQAISPGPFNLAIQRHGNKSDVLSNATLELVHSMCAGLSGPIEIVCDKHGGRNRYAAVIGQTLTDQFVHVTEESRALSRYYWEEKNRNCKIEFRAKGESKLPIALASMIAKYVREISMTIWNQFWAIEVPGIRPTKGYPGDAKRFKDEIRSHQEKLGIADHLIWRCR
ncbi:MAG: hypothetical protein AAGA30_21475 [Planctomycetota bacterium]